MRRLACPTALLALLSLASGCTLYFGDDDHGDDICADDTYVYELRDPTTGSCVDFGGGGGCYGAPQADPDWAACESGCEALDETSCLATPGCRGAYAENIGCGPGGDCLPPETQTFLGCWGTAPSGPIQGPCDGLDAQGCSEHDDCVAVYNQSYGPDDGLIQQFSYCAPEPWSQGCYSDADCPAGYECNADTACMPDPSCPPGADCPAICYGQCVPAQNGCDTVDCGPGSHCELQCYPCDPTSPDGTCTDRPCDAVCVPDYPTCDSTTCGPGSHCETQCYPDPTCDPGPDGGVCADVCTETCVPDNPGSCYGDVLCDMAPPACPDGTTPGILDGCYTGYCIPLTDCDTPPPPACEGLDEPSCTSRPDCTALYDGTDCTCYPDGTCSCNVWTYDHCETSAYPWPDPGPVPL